MQPNLHRVLMLVIAAALLAGCGQPTPASPNPYGDLPEIRALQVNGYPACLIVPSGQPPAAAQGALFVWLAAGALTSDSGGDLLVLTADPAHIESVAGSLSLP